MKKLSQGRGSDHLICIRHLIAQAEWGFDLAIGFGNMEVVGYFDKGAHSVMLRADP